MQVIYKERKKTDCAKWDALEKVFGSSDLLPLWVADMDFEVPKCVKKALAEYVEQGTFGYYHPPKAYYDAFIRWEEMRHGYKVNPSWIRFSPGVVPAFHWLVNILTEPGDAVIINQPVYNPFREAIVRSGRKLVDSPLIFTGGEYTIDPVDFERKIIDTDVKLYIFCSPHNPVGRVWRIEEIKTIMDICRKHKVYVLSDEIHQDIILSGNKQIPAASAGEYNDFLLTLTAATKTFNLAACQNSFVIIPNPEIRKRFDAFTGKLRVESGNGFGYVAVRSAYEGGASWLSEVMEIVESNYRYVRETLKDALPDAFVADLQGTYLLWVDLGAYVPAGQMEKFLTEKCHLALDYGSWFGGKPYEGFIRINLATSRENVEKCVRSLIEALR